MKRMLQADEMQKRANARNVVRLSANNNEVKIWPPRFGFKSEQASSPPTFYRWPAQPLNLTTNKMIDAPALAPDLIPERLKPWVMDIAERMQIAPELVMAPAMVAFSCVVGRKIGIQPKKLDDRIVAPNLWGAVVTRTGYDDTASTSREALLPLKRLRGRTIEKGDDDYAESMVAKMHIRAFSEMIIDATKENSSVSIDVVKERLKEIVTTTRERKSRLRPYVTENSKRGNITRLIKDNPNGLLIINNDLAPWLDRLSKSKRSDERDFFLRTSPKDHLQADETPERSAPIAVFGKIGSHDLRRYLEKLSQKGREATMLGKFQMLVYPDLPTHLSNTDRKPNYLAREAAFDLFTKIDSVAASKSDYIPAVRFSDEGQEAFEHWLANLEVRLCRYEKESPALFAHSASYRLLMPSLSLLFSILEKPENIHAWNSVSMSAAKLAIAWCNFLEAHAKKVYGIPNDAETRAVRMMANHIESGQLRSGVKLKSVCDTHAQPLTPPPLIQQALFTLEGHGWLRISGSGGQKHISLHPQFESRLGRL